MAKNPTSIDSGQGELKFLLLLYPSRIRHDWIRAVQLPGLLHHTRQLVNDRLETGWLTQLEEHS